MSKRLDDLRKQFEESKVVAVGVNEEAAELKEVLAVKQAQVMETVRKDLREFAGYAAGLNKGWYVSYLHACQPGFAKSSYGDNFCLIVACEPDGNIKLQGNPSGYSYRVDIYDLKTDRWGWYSDKCKAYVTENWGMIAEQIEEGLARDLEKAAKNVVGSAVKQREALQKSIGAVEENVDWGARKDTVLYNAISLLLEDVWETSDDRKKGLLLLMDELGVTVDELEKMGVNLEEFGLEQTVDEVLADATERSEEYQGFNAYDEIQRLTALRKERPLTEDEEETLFYCKNATAEMDYYDSLE